jgi:hypothetical protein
MPRLYVKDFHREDLSGLAEYISLGFLRPPRRAQDDNEKIGAGSSGGRHVKGLVESERQSQKVLQGTPRMWTGFAVHTTQKDS